MSKEEMRDKIIEITKPDSKGSNMMCPFRTHQINYQTHDNGNTEVHQKSEFSDCYLEHCFYYKNKQCVRVLVDIEKVKYK